MNKLLILTFIPTLAIAFECGQSKFKDAGKWKDNISHQGWLSRNGEFPYQAVLKYLGTAICGGVLIDDRHILTAVHCTSSDPASEHTVVLGDHNRNKKSENRREYKVEKIIEHPEYDDRTMVNDIALIRLAEVVEFTDYIQPICLPEAGQSFVGSHVTLSGYSSFQPGSEMTEEARYINVEISDFEECKKCYSPEPVEPGMVCVGFCGQAKKHYACQGDLGGAAAVRVCDSPDAAGNCMNGGTFYLAGIVSWGYGCEDIYPGVFTDVPYYIDWIYENRK